MDYFKSKFFNLTKMTEGVYAAIVNEGTGAWGNAGIVDLGDATLIIDTFLTPSAASDLRRAAEAVSFSPVKYVINTHWHLDHTIGNHIFSDCVIFSTQETREYINTNLGNKNKATVLESWKKAIANLEIEKGETSNLQIQRGLELEIQELNRFIEEYPKIEITLPNSLLSHKTFELIGTKRNVQFHTLGGGHSISDTIVYLPEEKIVFTGDLVFVDTHPSIHNQPIEEWKTILEELSKLEINTLISGHGPIGTKEHIGIVSSYIQHLQETLLSNGDQTMPDKYRLWRFPHVYQWNLKALQKQFK